MLNKNLIDERANLMIDTGYDQGCHKMSSSSENESEDRAPLTADLEEILDEYQHDKCLTKETRPTNPTTNPRRPGISTRSKRGRDKKEEIQTPSVQSIQVSESSHTRCHIERHLPTLEFRHIDGYIIKQFF